MKRSELIKLRNRIEREAKQFDKSQTKNPTMNRREVEKELKLQWNLYRAAEFLAENWLHIRHHLD